MDSLPRIKVDLIAGLDEGRAAARPFVEALPPGLPVHSDSDWTVRDLVIHLTAIESDMLLAIQSASEDQEFRVELRGQATVRDLYELRRADRAADSWQQLLESWEQTRDQLRGLVIAFPNHKMDSSFSNPFFVNYNLVQAIRACGAHERLHLSEMRAAADNPRSA